MAFSMRRASWIFFAWMFFPTLVSLAGCTHKTTSPNEIVVGISAEPVSLDPRYATDAYSMRIADLIFSSLVKIGPHLEVVPDAAKTWSFKDNVYTFDLFPGLRFHNGRPVTPDDLKFSFEQFSDKNSLFSSSFNEVGKLEAETVGDHLRVRITMKHFVANFLGADLPVFKILPREEIAGFPARLIGTGSFRFVSRTDSEVHLEAVKDHPFEAPKTSTVVFKVVHDDFTRYQKLLKGELDVVFNDITTDKVRVFEQRPEDFNVYRFPSASMTYILMNMRDPTLQNRDLRRALSQSIHRSEIIQYKMAGMAKETTSILPPVHPMYNAEIKNPAYDVAAAQRTIESLGLKGHRLTIKSSNNPGVMDNSKVLAYQMSQSGLDVELETFEWGKFYDDVKKGNFQLATMKWIGISDPDIYRQAFNSKEKAPGGRNRSNYNNPIIDELTEKAIQTENEETRRDLYEKIQKIVLEDYAFIPLWAELQVVVTKKSITGFQPHMTGKFDILTKLTKEKIDSRMGAQLTTAD